METEIKAIIEGAKYLDLIYQAGRQKEAKYMTKIDDYYSKDPDAKTHPVTYRIRKVVSDNATVACFTMKIKRVDEKGLETNQEYETYLSDASVMERFLGDQGFVKNFTKSKTSHGFMAQLEKDGPAYHVEIVMVSKEGRIEPIYAVEIENTDDNKDVTPETHYANEKKLLEGMGISEDRIEAKSWRELLGE